MPGSDFTTMPRLPRNARYIIHRNECFDWGTIGWLLKSGQVAIHDFKYVVIMNSSVRGPFLPLYYKVGSYSPCTMLLLLMQSDDSAVERLLTCWYCDKLISGLSQTETHWTTLYTSRINDTIKLVGSTINCQPVYWRSNPANKVRHNPHVQSYVVATDQVDAYR